MGNRSQLLAKDVDVGLQLLHHLWLNGLAQRDTATALVGLGMFQRQLELLDATDILIQAGALGPARVQGRSFLETAVGLRYLLRVCDDRVAAAYLLLSQRRILSMLRDEAARHAPGSRPTIDAREAQESYDRIEGHLSRWAKREIERLAAESGGAVAWYQTFDGPKTLRALVNRLEDPGFQDQFGYYYELWSDAVHAGSLRLDPIGGVVTDNKPFEPIRYYVADSLWKELIETVHYFWIHSVQDLVHHFGVEMPMFARIWFVEQGRILGSK